MSQALPPLNALKAFEAAARHANFARAAAELNVTPGALSHQIRGLEALLGVALFERQARGVALTLPGRTLYPGLRAGFAQVREAVAALRASTHAGALVISAPPGFTSKWLVPRLHRFTATHPDVELRISASTAYANFVGDGVDVAVRNLPIGAPPDPALEHDPLVDDVLVAVCSPALLAKAGRRGAPTDLRGLPLIHDEQLAGRPEVPTWADWLRAAGLPPVDLRRGLRMSSPEHALAAALQGAGLLLAHALLAHDDLACGRLVMPFEVALPGGRRYMLVQPKGRPVRLEVEAFRRWLHAEIRAMSKPARRRTAKA